MEIDKKFRLELPKSLRQKLLEFRKRVWTIKSIEGAGIALFGILLAFLVVYISDRIWDTPARMRGIIALIALTVCCVIPWVLYRWVWKNRRLEQLAMLLRRKHPSVGDQLLGIIELVRSDEEQARSRELCEAAVAQVSQEAQSRDLSNSVPNPRHKLWTGLAIGGALVALVLALFSPPAAGNAWVRYLMPWKDTPRYTFTKIDPQSNEQVVPHGEPFSLNLKLADDTVWHPEQAKVVVGKNQPMASGLNGSDYEFDCPPQLADTSLKIAVGDFSQKIKIQPKLRPELTSVTANIKLPEYLQREGDVEQDVRGGSGTFVKGSEATITAAASRDLNEASINGTAVPPNGTSFCSTSIPIDGDKPLVMEWKDAHGLNGAKPFELQLRSRDDEAPTIICQGLSRRAVVLLTETLKFELRGFDDFGVKQVGIEWEGYEGPMNPEPAKGERILSAGSPTSEEMTVVGTFSPSKNDIKPQPIKVRMFAEDYLPDRERTYSPTYVMYVLSPEDHAIWLTDQLSKWHRHSLEVRDREMQLYEKNKQLKGLDAKKLDDPNVRREIEKQASAERSNGRRLNRLVGMGEDLVKQASRNEEFGVGHLEKWAEMLQVLKDISNNRMPSVASLLKEASKAEKASSGSGQSEQVGKQLAKTEDPKASKGGGSEKKQKSGPNAGMSRATPQGGDPDKPSEDEQEKPAIPTIADMESTQQPPEKDVEPSEPGEKKSGGARLTLPTTTLLGKAKAGEACPTGDKMEEAVEEQRQLLVEFEKVAEELNKVLANLEGSTLVKRLKAAARSENKIAGRIADSVKDAFGVTAIAAGDVRTLFGELRTKQTDTLQNVSHIMDDMDAFYERRRMAKFKNILAEMEDEDVLGALRDLSDEMKKESGVSIAQCEYWSDTMDRWAEDLVDPAGGGT